MDYPMPGAYLRAVKRANTITANGGTVRLFWNTADLDANAWRREFRAALDRRISARGGLLGTGRRWTDDYETAMRRDGRAIRNTHNRIIVRVTEITTDDWRKRFAHLYTRD